MHSVWILLYCLYSLVVGVLAAPKILICSDSTTADYNASSPLQGWGHFLGEYMAVPVINKARNGRSTRSFIRETLWSQLLDLSSPGDFIVVEMGHNDVSQKACRASTLQSKANISQAGDPSMKNNNT